MLQRLQPVPAAPRPARFEVGEYVRLAGARFGYDYRIDFRSSFDEIALPLPEGGEQLLDRFILAVRDRAAGPNPVEFRFGEERGRLTVRASYPLSAQAELEGRAFKALGRGLAAVSGAFTFLLERYGDWEDTVLSLAVAQRP